MNHESYIEIEETVGNYTVRVRGKSPKEVAKQIVDTANALGVSGTTRPGASSKAKSVTEFINSLHPKTDNDRTLCCAHYLQNYRNTESITTKDLKAAYREAKLPTSTNPSRAIDENVKRGYLAPTGKKKEGYNSFYVTSDGTEYVQAGLKAK